MYVCVYVKIVDEWLIFSNAKIWLKSELEVLFSLTIMNTWMDSRFNVLVLTSVSV